jgi:hypothetical protein
MKIVSRFEANLLKLLHFFLGRVPREQVMLLLADSCPRPECLSRAAISLIEESLAKGCVHLLARQGGWRQDRFLRDGQASEGRLWDRTPPAKLGLEFSEHSLRFLMWITASKPAEESSHWNAAPTDLTPADQLLLYYAYRSLHDTDVAQVLRKKEAFKGNALCCLAFPQEFQPTVSAATFAVWTTGLGACILEALQDELADRWVAMERSKALIGDWQQMLAVGRSQSTVLDAFLAAVDQANRLDLVRFLLRALWRLLPQGASAQFWLNPRMAAAPRMADRVEVIRGAMALLMRTEHFQRWDQRARSVGYFDEGYAASQLTKAEWERWGGDDVHARAQSIIRELDPMRVTNTATEGRT